MIYNIKPVPKPRQTQSDRWKQRPCVMRYRDFKDQVREEMVELPENGAHVTFYLPMPKSWSEKKKKEMKNKPHKSRPDLSNLIKALEDALFIEDSHIWDYRLTKVWHYNGFIEIKDAI